MLDNLNPYPEHDKLDNNTLEIMDNLVEWLNEQGYSICKLDKIDYVAGKIEHANWQDLRVEFFGTTEKKLEVERKRILESLR